MVIWTAEKETSIGTSFFEPIDVSGPYWVKYPVSVGESWALDNGEENCFEYRCGLPVSNWIGPTGGHFPPMGPYFSDPEFWICLSTDTLVTTPAGNFSSYNFSGEFWSEGVGKVGADRVFWKEGTVANPVYELHLKTQLIDYQIN